jgi:branched-chain amino acid transport system permease protein
MLYLQVAANGLVLGGLYACIAVGFSLVWGVLNVINILHGSFIVLGSYLALFAYQVLGLHPFLAILPVAAALYAVGHATQGLLVNRVIAAPVLMTLTLTFGLDLVLNNTMIVAFSADYQRLNLETPLGVLFMGEVVLPGDRVASMALALLLTGGLWLLLRGTRLGRAVVAVRMDRDAAALMGVNVPRINAVTFGLGAAMAGAAGVLLAIIFPISPLNSGLFLGKAFTVCVLGGLGSVPGALVGGIALGLIESFGALWLGPEWAITISFMVLIAVLALRPDGLLGRRGFA